MVPALHLIRPDVDHHHPHFKKDLQTFFDNAFFKISDLICFWDVDGSGKRLKMTTACLSGRTLESVIKKRDRFFRYFPNEDDDKSDDDQDANNMIVTI